MIEPLGYTVLVSPEEVETKTASGIVYVLDSNVDKMERASVCGKIVAIGPLAWMKPDFGFKHWADLGDYILFAKYAGSMVSDPDTGENYIMLADEDIRIRYKKGIKPSMSAANDSAIMAEETHG